MTDAEREDRALQALMLKMLLHERTETLVTHEELEAFDKADEGLSAEDREHLERLDPLAKVQELATPPTGEIISFPATTYEIQELPLAAMAREQKEDFGDDALRNALDQKRREALEKVRRRREDERRADE